MPNLYLVIGTAHARKSALVRCLTGAFHRKLYEVETQNGTVDFFVQVRSLQEPKISPDEFVNTINDNAYTNVICTLRARTAQGLPDCVGYINAFLNAGFTLSGIVLLGSCQGVVLPHGCPQPLRISNPRTIPANLIASQVRQAWGIL